LLFRTRPNTVPLTMKTLLTIRLALVAVWLAVVSCSASAQSGTDPFQASGGKDTLRHRNFTGKPCLSIGGMARPHTIDPNLYDHVIAVTNSCPQRIAIRICYFHSLDCIRLEIPGSERKEAILGTMPSLKEFRFEFREIF
jgi:hypothetical protein